MSRWDKNDFPPQNWAELGKKVIGHDNLFAMIDYLLTQNVSSAEAERGFSVLKGTKNSKRATLTNRYLSNQMRVMLSGKRLEQFNFEQPIDIWLGLTSTRRMNKK